MLFIKRVLSNALPWLAASASVFAQGTSTASGEHGVDTAAMDRTIKAGDDFFGYANGAWVTATVIPADRDGWGMFQVLGKLANRRISELVENAGKANAAEGSAERTVADYYSSFMDEAGIEAKGMAPLAPELKRISAIKDRHALSRALGAQVRNDVDPLNNTNFFTTNLFGLWVSPDLNSPDHYVPYLLQGGLGLPDREYFLATSTRMAEIRTKYRAHIAAMLTLAGISDAKAKAARIFELERKMALVHVGREDSEDVLKANNPWNRTDFATRAPGIEWTSFFTAADLDKAPIVIVWHPSAVSGLSKLVASEPLATWKEWMTFHAIGHFGGVLPSAIVAERFAFYGKTMTGTPQIQERRKRAANATSDALGDAVGQLYAEQYFSPEAKAQVQSMVKNIVAALGQRIDRLDWMSPQTKVKAKEKLYSMYVGVGYADKWIDYSNLKIVKGDAYGNAERAERFDYQRQLAKLGTQVDRPSGG